MGFIDEFDDCMTETVIVNTKKTVPDGLDGVVSDGLEVKGSFKAFVDYLDTSEKNIADKYVGKIMIIIIGKSSEVIASGIAHNDIVVWDGKSFEVLPPDGNTANQFEQGEIKAMYIETVS